MYIPRYCKINPSDCRVQQCAELPRRLFTHPILLNPKYRWPTKEIDICSHYEIDIAYGVWAASFCANRGPQAAHIRHIRPNTLGCPVRPQWSTGTPLLAVQIGDPHAFQPHLPVIMSPFCTISCKPSSSSSTLSLSLSKLND